MSRYYLPGPPFMYSGAGEPASGMDCLQLRQQPTGPFHYLINEQAKSLVALQELQHEVGALLEFRDLVIETFPNLRTKMSASSSPATMMTSSNIPVAVRREWEPGVRVRRKLHHNKDDGRMKKSESSTQVQDSGFSTETSSKETHSASSSTTAALQTNAAVTDETEDELLNLLEVIHRKGTRLKDEVEALQGALRDQGNSREESDFQRTLFHGSADDVRQLRRERDMLLDRVAEMEAEVLAGRVHTSRLQEDLEHLLSAKQDLEEQLRNVVSQSGEVNSRIHDLHLEFVSSKVGAESRNANQSIGANSDDVATSQRTPKSNLDAVLGNHRIPKVAVPDSKKIAAILKEYDPIVLQKHLLMSTVQNQVLQLQLNTAARLELNLVDKLEKAREENSDLKFQLEDKNIELEGTRATVRMLENLKKQSPDKSPDIIMMDSERSEISTSSMKAMSPFPLLNLDHSSSTESAHDQSEMRNNKHSSTETPQRRRPSKIPLVKSYAAPKPPTGAVNGGKHSPAPGARSRSGESPGRSHSAQSWRKSEGNSLTGKSNTSLNKSRNVSLTNAKDSLTTTTTGKMRNESLKTKDSSVNSFGSNTMRGNHNSNGVLRKSLIHASGGAGSVSSTPVRRNNSVNKDATSNNDSKTQSQWILSYGNCSDLDQYPDSLNRSTPNSSTNATSAAFFWMTANKNLRHQQFYDSIDSTNNTGLYQNDGGEDFAECDSLEKPQQQHGEQSDDMSKC